MHRPAIHANAYFGHAISLDSAGNTLAVGAIGDNAGGLNAGAVYLFTRSAGLWSQQAYVKAAHIETNAYFGFSVALNGDGDTLAIGAHGKCGHQQGRFRRRLRLYPQY